MSEINMLTAMTHRVNRRNVLLSVCALIALTVTGAAAFADEENSRNAQSILEHRCLQCHDGEAAEAGIDLSQQQTSDLTGPDIKKWKQVLEVLHSRAMPPRGEGQLTTGERKVLTAWVEGILSQPGPDGQRDPGEVVLRRLNGAEYNYTILELFGLPRLYVRNYNPAQGAPKKPVRISRKTTLPIYMPVDDAGYGFDNIGEVLTLPPFLMEHYVSTAHDVVEKVSGSGPESLNSSSRNSDVLMRGSRVFNAIPANADPHAEARRRLGEFLYRAFRHPVSDEQLQTYLNLFEQSFEESKDFQEALKLPIQAALVSPHFLFRIEGDPSETPGEIVRVSDYELASRLSYFLWSTMPDRELLRLAEQGKLHDEKVLEQQVRRMLKDKRAMALSDHFALQWLQIETVESAMPDPEQFPQFAQQRGHMLLNYMSDEARLLFEAVMFDDRSILDFIDPDYAYLNEVLAKHYGVYDPQFHQGKMSERHYVRYELPDKRRGGVLTLASVLTATSQSTRTSPVARGKWVLETILGTPPPPPADNVPALEEAAPESANYSLREKLKLHRADPACASCHDRMDPFGLALENYDPIGVWRDKEQGKEIVIDAELPSGKVFKSPVELKTYLATERKDDFVRAFSEHMLTYALGRPLDYYDIQTVRQITDALEQNDYRFTTLVLEITRSYPFQYRRTREARDAD
jgi:hypothetical protein